MKLSRPGSRAAYVIASVTASRRLQFASRGVATPRRQRPAAWALARRAAYSKDVPNVCVTDATALGLFIALCGRLASRAGVSI